MMVKENVVIDRGRIVEALPSGQYRIQCDDERIVLAQVANRVRRDLRYLAVGEEVALEFTPYDLARGRITSRSGSAVE